MLGIEVWLYYFICLKNITNHWQKGLRHGRCQIQTVENLLDSVQHRLCQQLVELPGVIFSPGGSELTLLVNALELLVVVRPMVATPSATKPHDLLAEERKANVQKSSGLPSHRTNHALVYGGKASALQKPQRAHCWHHPYTGRSGSPQPGGIGWVFAECEATHLRQRQDHVQQEMKEQRANLRLTLLARPQGRQAIQVAGRSERSRAVRQIPGSRERLAGRSAPSSANILFGVPTFAETTIWKIFSQSTWISVVERTYDLFRICWICTSWMSLQKGSLYAMMSSCNVFWDLGLTKPKNRLRSWTPENYVAKHHDILEKRVYQFLSLYTLCIFVLCFRHSWEFWRDSTASCDTIHSVFM